MTHDAAGFEQWAREHLERHYPSGITKEQRDELRRHLTSAEGTAAVLAGMNPSSIPSFLAKHPDKAAAIVRQVVDRLTKDT